MNILLIFPGFIIALIIVLYYEYKIRRTEPKNNVRLYVKVLEDNLLRLFIQKKNGNLELFAVTSSFTDFGLNPLDFYNMKAGEIREVFLNMEDQYEKQKSNKSH